MKFLGDEYLAIRDMEANLTPWARKQLLLNNYFQVNRNAYAFLYDDPPDLLRYLLRRNAQLHIMMSSKTTEELHKYQKVIAKYEGWRIEELQQKLHPTNGSRPGVI